MTRLSTIGLGWVRAKYYNIKEKEEIWKGGKMERMELLAVVEACFGEWYG